MFKDVLKVAVVVGGIALVGAGTYAVVSPLMSALTAPSRVINKTLETNNIIHNYEWFHDTNAAYLTRVNQIRDYRGFLKDEKDNLERNRLRVELAAIQQTCRDLVTRYNANSIKTNRSIFKGREAPENLDINTCE